MRSVKLDKSLKYILPFKINDLIRFGNKNDSGYIISKKPMNNVNFMLSFGMSNNWSFEESFLKVNFKNKVQIYDHTVGYSYFFYNLCKSIKRILYFKSNLKNVFEKYNDLIGYHRIINNNRIKHLQIKVSNRNIKGEENLKNIFRKIKHKKILLSIDIEGDEYKILKNLVKYSELIHLLIIEFHYLDKNKSLFKKIINNLKKKFEIIHIHGNNYTSYCDDGMPKTLEMTFRNKKIYPIRKKKYVKKFPVKYLDYPNFKKQKDLKFHY